MSVWYGNSLKKMYLEAMEKYEASKRLIEVENAKRHGYLYLINTKEGKHIGLVENNTPCKAKVTGDTCIIVELIKE